MFHVFGTCSKPLSTSAYAGTLTPRLAKFGSKPSAAPRLQKGRTLIFSFVGIFPMHVPFPGLVTTHPVTTAANFERRGPISSFRFSFCVAGIHPHRFMQAHSPLVWQSSVLPATSKSLLARTFFHYCVCSYCAFPSF